MEKEDVIKHQMEESRAALGEKLETLEKQVAHTVQGAAEAVNATVETIKDTVSTVNDTVSSVKHSVEDTVTAVKDSVSDSVDTMKEWVDIRAHVDHHPWLCIGGGIAAGYALGVLFTKATSTFQAAEPQRQDGARFSNEHSQRTQSNGHGRDRKRSSHAASSWLGEFMPEMQQLKSLALGTLLGTAREMIVKAVPADLGHHLGEIVDNVTTKLGGKPMPNSEWLGSGEDQDQHSPDTQNALGHLGGR